MPLEFCYRRRILIGPDARSRAGAHRTPKPGQRRQPRDNWGWAGRMTYDCQLSSGCPLQRASHAAFTSSPSPVDLAGVRAERADSADPRGVGADRRLPADQRRHPRCAGGLPAAQRAGGPEQRGGARGQDHRRAPAQHRGADADVPRRRLPRAAPRGLPPRRPGAPAPRADPDGVFYTRSDDGRAASFYANSTRRRSRTARR